MQDDDEKSATASHQNQVVKRSNRPQHSIEIPPTPTRPYLPQATPGQYYSIYNGSCLSRNGKFSHFFRQVDPFHYRHGYWRFGSVEDDRIAHSLKFSSPEDVLIEQDQSDESFDGMLLIWFPGQNDDGLIKPISGTALSHLQTIYDVRSKLGMPMSFRGQMPIYPISDDARLKLYWETNLTAKTSGQLITPQQSSWIPAPLAQNSTEDNLHLPDSRSGWSFGQHACSFAQQHSRIPEGIDSPHKLVPNTVDKAEANIPLFPSPENTFVAGLHQVNSSLVQAIRKVPPKRPNTTPIPLDQLTVPPVLPAKATSPRTSSTSSEVHVSQSKPSINATILQNQLEASRTAQTPPAFEQILISSPEARLQHRTVAYYPSLPTSPGQHALSSIRSYQSSPYPCPPQPQPSSKSTQDTSSRNRLRNENESQPVRVNRNVLSQVHNPSLPTRLILRSEDRSLSQRLPLDGYDREMEGMRVPSIIAAFDISIPKAAIHSSDEVAVGKAVETLDKLATISANSANESSTTTTSSLQPQYGSLNEVHAPSSTEDIESGPMGWGNGVNILGDNGDPLVHEHLSPLALDMYPGLPCMDCGYDKGHRWNCHVGSKCTIKSRSPDFS